LQDLQSENIAEEKAIINMKYEVRSTKWNLTVFFLLLISYFSLITLPFIQIFIARILLPFNLAKNLIT
jgi:hypothetical protein